MSFLRRRISLDGSWQFWVDPEQQGEAGRLDRLGLPRVIEVPGAWQAQFDDLRHYQGAAWYRRQVTLPPGWQGAGLRLCFGAVDYHARLWLNGHYVGEHEGGYLPFSFAIGRFVHHDGPNELVVRVLEPDQDDPRFPAAEIPHGKQNWYGPLGGIWQSVYLETVGAAYVEGARIEADPAAAAVRFQVRTAGAAPARIRCRVTAPDGLTSWEAEGADAIVGVPEPVLWDVENPALYSATVLVEVDGKPVDLWTDTFGFRTVEARGGRVWLNGRPIFLMGALDQDYYPETICTPPSDEFLRQQMLRAKEMGLNLLRCHIKVPDPRYLYWADRLGLLVWAELPNWSRFSSAAAERGRQTLAGMVERDFNHPSLIIWTVINEGWGANLPGDQSHRNWVAESYRWLKRLDPTRLVVDNSPCPPNFHMESDLNDFHWYRSIPDHLAEWRAWTRSWVADPASTYSPHGDGVRRGDEPLIVSEFGNWGLPDPARLRSDTGADPWWYETGAAWGHGEVLPSGIEDRFARWGFGEIFGSLSGLARESQEHLFESLKTEIEDMRSHGPIAGYAITEFTDVHWECNGLLDLRRQPKVFHGRLGQIQQPDLIVPLWERLQYRLGERIELGVALSHWSRTPLSGATLEWELDDQSGRIGPVSPERFTTTALGSISALAAAEGRRRLHLRLLDGVGRPVCENWLDLLVLPARRSGAADRVRVVRSLDAGALAAIAAGEKVICLATPASQMPPGLKVTARKGSKWEGDWAQGMFWIRPGFLRAPLGPRLDLTCAGVMPEAVIEGYDAATMVDVYGGYYVGWLHHAVATIAGFRVGAGAAIITTLPLDGANPLAEEILDGLAERLLELERHR